MPGVIANSFGNPETLYIQRLRGGGHRPGNRCLVAVEGIIQNCENQESGEYE
jgi:hypothetical protein